MFLFQADIIDKDKEQPKPIMIFYKSLIPPNLTKLIRMQSNNTIMELQTKLIESGEGETADELRIIFNAKKCESSSTLSSNNIINESTVHVLKGLGGGGKSVKLSRNDKLKAKKSNVVQLARELAKVKNECFVPIRQELFSFNELIA